MRKAIGVIAAFAALGMSGSVLAAPYFLKIKGVEGESKDSEHKDWIIIESLSIAGPKTSGGANVAAGDVNDGAPVPPPRAAARVTGPMTTERASHEATHSVQQRASATKEPEGGESPVRGLAAQEPDPVPAGLLLPAVQKVRTAHLKRSAWTGCQVGQRLGMVQIRDQATGRTGRILDASVAECASEHVSLNFSKIEW